jgi:hypothetical protein
MSGVSYISGTSWRSLLKDQLWTFRGDPFCPAFVVELDTFIGPCCTRSLSEFQIEKYINTDFTKYGVYSYACVMKEVITKRIPWY